MFCLISFKRSSTLLILILFVLISFIFNFGIVFEILLIQIILKNCLTYNSFFSFNILLLTPYNRTLYISLGIFSNSSINADFGIIYLGPRFCVLVFKPPLFPGIIEPRFFCVSPPPSKLYKEKDSIGYFFSSIFININSS